MFTVVLARSSTVSQRKQKGGKKTFGISLIFRATLAKHREKTPKALRVNVLVSHMQVQSVSVTSEHEAIRYY